MLADPEVMRANQWPHNVSLLRTAHGAGCRTALASMSHCDQVMHILKVLGLADQFELILSHEDVEHPKPDPKICRLAAHALHEQPAGCVVIEDSPAGVQTALATGVNCVAVSILLTREALHTQNLLPAEQIVNVPVTLPAVVERLVLSRGGHLLRQ